MQIDTQKEVVKSINVDESSMAEKSIDELTSDRDNLIADVDAKQKELASALYDIEFDSLTNIGRVLKYIDKNTKWSIQDAALVINLYDNLKLERARLTNDDSKSTTVRLNSIDLNSLYKTLMAIDGVGISSARNFITLLTNVGSQISDAMQLMGDANKCIQGMHIALSELDTAIEHSNEQTNEDDMKVAE